MTFHYIYKMPSQDNEQSVNRHVYRVDRSALAPRDVLTTLLGNRVTSPGVYCVLKCKDSEPPVMHWFTVGSRTTLFVQ